MTEPYLVLHKVRGAPAFDIAIQIQIGDEEGWIIPTSGHRAYPWFTRPLTAWHIATTPHFTVTMADAPKTDPMPEDWPDHYSCNNKSTQRPTLFTNLLEQLGMVKKVERRF